MLDFLFLPFQTDLYNRNPEVKEEMFNIMRFWLDKGINRFRLDILNTKFEDIELKNNIFRWILTKSNKKSASLFHQYKYDANLLETYDFVLDLRKLIEEYKPD